MRNDCRASICADDSISIIFPFFFSSSTNCRAVFGNMSTPASRSLVAPFGFFVDVDGWRLFSEKSGFPRQRDLRQRKAYCTEWLLWCLRGNLIAPRGFRTVAFATA